MGLSSSSLSYYKSSYERNCPLSELGARTSHKQFVFGNTGSGFATTFAIMFAMLGICFNLLVIVALLHYRRTRRHVTTPFIISLSFLDLITAVFVLPVYAFRFHKHATPFGEFGCKMYALIFYGTQGATMLSLTMVTLNRLVMLFFPKKVDKIFTNNITIKGHIVPLNSLIILFFCWVIPLIILSPTFVGKYGSMGLQEHTQSCTLMKNTHTGSNPKRLVMIIGIGIPAATMIISDIAIFFKMKAIHATDYRMSLATVEDRKMERRFMMMLVAIFLIFFITYVPASLFKQIDKCFKYPSLQITGYVINWSSVWINPIVYVASQKKYQEALKHLKLMVMKKLEQKKEDNNQVILAFQLESSEKSQEPSAGGVNDKNLFPDRPKTHSNSFYSSGYDTEN